MDALSNSTRSLSLSHSVMLLGWRMASPSLRPFLRQTKYWSYRFCLSESLANGWNELRGFDDDDDDDDDGMLAESNFRICSSLDVDG